MRFLLRVFVVFALVLVALSFFRNLFSPDTSRGQRPETRGRGSAKLVKDPVCGTYVTPNAAVSVRGGAETVYFCSETCRDKFLASSPNNG